MLDYKGQIIKGKVTIVHVPTQIVFNSWESALKFDKLITN